MIPEAVNAWLREESYGEVRGERPVGGGCINHGARLETSSGRTFFLKTNSHTPVDMFLCEAEGLAALAVAGVPRVPQVHLAGPDFLLLEDLAPAPRRGDYWATFGRQLAALHHHTQPRFGFNHNNYLGSTPQPNPWTGDGYRFYAEQRLLYQARLAQSRGLLGNEDLRRAESVARRLPELVPDQPASLLHGDLWSGNATSDSYGSPAIIDPAVYYGWAEAELAMTALFGGYPDAFYQAYWEVRPLEPGFSGRLDLYNLYHLLNHLNLFGEGYRGEVVSILRAYASSPSRPAR